MATTSTETALKKLRKVLDVVSDVDMDMQINTLQLLIEVAAAGDEGILQQDLMKKTGMSQAAVSRNAAALTKKTPYNTNSEGPGLVENVANPENNRQKLVRLTARGRRVVEQITSNMT